MTLGELKVIALQKMQAAGDDHLSRSRDSEPYIDRMRAPVNEALLLIATAARPILRRLCIEQAGREGEAAFRRHDLRALCEHFFNLAPGGVYREARGVTERTADYLLEPDGALLLPNCAGQWHLHCHTLPPEIGPDTPDSFELPIDPDAAALLPLYVASQLYKEDDLPAAVQLRNEFELGLQRLAAATPAGRGGLRFRSARGWYRGVAR
ncbi:MAG: hypothetical protein GXX99_01570 [Clostridiales bacterium]|nr:hypothetical protein [Clostridiales bacterium]